MSRDPSEPLSIDDVFVIVGAQELRVAASRARDAIEGEARRLERSLRETKRDVTRGANDVRRETGKLDRDVARLLGVDNDRSVDGVKQSASALSSPDAIVASLPVAPDFSGEPPQFVDPRDFTGWPGQLGRQPPGPDGDDNRDRDERRGPRDEPPDRGDGENGGRKRPPRDRPPKPGGPGGGG